MQDPDQGHPHSATPAPRVAASSASSAPPSALNTGSYSPGPSYNPGEPEVEPEMRVPLHPLTLRFDDLQLERDYLMWSARNLQSYLARATALLVSVSFVMVAFVWVVGAYSPKLAGDEARAVFELLLFVVMPAGAAAAVASRWSGFLRHHQSVLVLCMLYVCAGAIHIVCRPGSAIYASLGLTLSVINLYNLLMLSRIRLRTSIVLSMLYALAYGGAGLWRGEAVATAIMCTGVLGGATLFASAGGMLLERFRRTTFYSQLQSEQRRVEAEKLSARLRQLSRVDGLTGIANRRRFDEWLIRAWARGSRESTPVSLLMVDIDQYKRYNDTYGHQQGDAALVDIASVIKGAGSRPDDLAARYGGEEFAIVLPDTDTQGAIAVAGRVRDAVVGLAIPHATSGVAPHITVSMGIATMVPTGDLPAILVKRADRALYAAKQAGRDRHVTWSAALTGSGEA